MHRTCLRRWNRYKEREKNELNWIEILFTGSGLIKHKLRIACFLAVFCILWWLNNFPVAYAPRWIMLSYYSFPDLHLFRRVEESSCLSNRDFLFFVIVGEYTFSLPPESVFECSQHEMTFLLLRLWKVIWLLNLSALEVLIGAFWTEPSLLFTTVYSLYAKQNWTSPGYSLILKGVFDRSQWRLNTKGSLFSKMLNYSRAATNDYFYFVLKKYPSKFPGAQSDKSWKS